MPLVQYSDTESEEDATEQHEVGSTLASTKRLCHDPHVRPEANGRNHSALPPLPTEFRDLYSTSVRVSVQDDPNLHNGRIRAAPHVVGSWPTHIYLEWYPNNSELEMLSEIIARCEATGSDNTIIHSLLYSDLRAQTPLHISLSRPVALLTDQREPFLDMFYDGIDKSGVHPFEVSISSLDWVSNFEHTRWFLVLRLDRPANDNLNRLLNLSNRSLAQFNQPPLYGNHIGIQNRKRVKQEGLKDGPPQSPDLGNTDYTDSFHVSVAWKLEEPSTEDKEQLLTVDLQPRKFDIKFNNIKVKVGNQIHSAAFPTSIRDESGLEGI
ncbi:hypothetical protein FQN49_002518 [Arthroderma sp. PD_2]|nr:hypothetical protein FQN49_002518 [Arthroderma sp. PD_2]